MPKTIKNIYEKITSFENLHAAYLNARRHKRYKKEILRYSTDLERQILILKKKLDDETYEPGGFREFYIKEPKTRLIMAQSFQDRVVQWAFYQVLNPLFVKGYITDSYACIEGRGQMAAINRLKEWLYKTGKWQNDNEKWYYLKIDFAKYFYRIDHEVIINEFNRKVSDERVQRWAEKVIRNNHTNFGLPVGKGPGEVKRDERIPGKGVPVGSLFSQMVANLNLNPLDQYCKRTLSIKYYIRYMDDIIILHNDKKQLQEWKRLIIQYADEKLKLSTNNKTCVRPINLGLEFCGFKMFPTYIKLRKSTALHMKRALKKVKEKYENGEITLDRVQSTVNSYLGILKHCDSNALKAKIFGDYENGIDGWFALIRKKDETEEIKEHDE